MKTTLGFPPETALLFSALDGCCAVAHDVVVQLHVLRRTVHPQAVKIATRLEAERIVIHFDIGMHHLDVARLPQALLRRRSGC